MLFDIVLLRQAGHRRLRADVLREMPIRGNVATADTGARSGLIATLTVAGAPHWRLVQCRVTRMARESLVLVGVEDDQAGMRHQQEWWCRLPGGEPPQPFDPDPPSAVQRDPSYARVWVMPTSVGYARPIGETHTSDGPAEWSPCGAPGTCSIAG